MSEIKMMQGDCMEFMAGVEDGFYDLAIVDPPYGIGDVADHTPRKKGAKKTKIHKNKDWNDCPPQKEYFIELFRVSKNQIIWGANYFSEILPASRGWIFWDKVYENTFNFSDGELAYTSYDRLLKKYKLSARWIPGTPPNIHPTQKPVKLYEWLLTNYAKPGNKILDTHGGSGSICIACHNLGFDLDWIEKDTDYFEAATKRFNDHARQGQMFL
jgi:site-specific DNA-methyltransferase (adenine-specific)